MADIPGKRLLAYDHHVTCCVRYSLGTGRRGGTWKIGQTTEGTARHGRERGAMGNGESDQFLLLTLLLLSILSLPNYLLGFSSHTLTCLSL